MSLWTSNMTPPPWIFLSFLYTLYGQVSGKSSEVAIELSILVSWIATTCSWWKSRKASNSSFLPLMLLIFMLMNFNPLIKLLLFVPQGEDLSFFSFVRGTNLFSVSKFTCSPKKESEKLKNSHFGQIHVQFVLFTVPYWVSAMNEHSLWIHISQLSHPTALWPFRTAPLQRPQSALQLVQYQALSPDSILTSSLSPKRAARFVTGNYNYETGSMTGILGQLKWESLKKRRKDNRLILLYKGLKGEASVPTDDLIPKT